MVLPWRWLQCGQFRQQCLVERRILFHDLFRQDGAFYLHLLRDRREHLHEGRHALRQRQIDALRFRRYRQARRTE